MLLCHGPQSLCYDQTRRMPPHPGSHPAKAKLGKKGNRLIHSHYYGSDRRSYSPFPKPDRENKTPLSILRTEAGRGETKKWLCIAWWGFFWWRVLARKTTISVELRVAILIFPCGVCGWVFSLLCLRLFLPITDIFLGALLRV